MTASTPAHVRQEPLRRLLRALAIAVVAAAGVLVLVFGVFPTRTWLAQRAEAGRAQEQLDVLDEQNAVLEERIHDLGTDAEIERLAREMYALVKPGEEAYAVLPPPHAEIDLPSIWPFGPLIPPSSKSTTSDGVPSDR